MLQEYKTFINQYLQEHFKATYPEHLYKPVEYILQLDGKRIRPMLVLLAAEGYGKDRAYALPAGAALEVFHNFTLMHDDIMDKAYFRRGKPTVHRKWDENTAILSGDVMVFLAQKLLENYPPDIFASLQKLYNQTAIEICEGQQLDLDFEQKEEITSREYLEMISKKTAVLLGTSLAFGGILAGQSKEEISLLYAGGKNIGIAFQIMDDYLDLYGDENFGKKIGGDILEKKKTFLYVTALETLPRPKKEKLIEWYHAYTLPDDEKIQKVKQLFAQGDIPQKTLSAIRHYTQKAIEALQNTRLNNQSKEILLSLTEDLQKRMR